MAQNIRTQIYCYDDHRGFSEEVKKRFADASRYLVLSFQTREELLAQLEAENENKLCKVAILGVHETKENYEMIDQLTSDIKKIDHRTGLILLGPPDKMAEIKKYVMHNIDAFIPKNANSILRIHNTVKKLISEYNIGIFKKRRNLSFYFLLIFFALSALLVLISYFRFPQYF